jgi:hypothetical protein
MAVVQRAESEIGEAVTAAIAKHSLTYGEIFGVLSGLLARWAQHAVHDERNPRRRRRAESSKTPERVGDDDGGPG